MWLPGLFPLGVPNLQELINAEGVEGTLFTVTPLLKKVTIPHHNSQLAEISQAQTMTLSLAFAICRHTKQSNSVLWETHSENLCT